ncbi:hypothetical protein PAXRUDRAFT_144068, partial [Paxillus rubicundulus Ve08.2h10]
LEVLLSQCLSSDNGSNFKKPTFTVAAMHLKVKFPNTSGAEKMCAVCQGKWTALKAAYNAVVDIKNTSGFTWSDEHSGGIVLKHDDIWDWYIKVCISPISHVIMKPYKNKGFRHFNAIGQMMPKIVKGTRILWPPLVFLTTSSSIATASSTNMLTPPLSLI